jgi:hypothetical protein
MSFLSLWEKLKLSPAKRDKVILSLFASAVIINIVLWALIVFNFWNVSDFIVLQYNIYFGISSFGYWAQLLFMPLLGLVIIIVDIFASMFLHLNYRHLSYFVCVSALVVNLILVVAGMLLVYSNL